MFDLFQFSHEILKWELISKVCHFCDFNFGFSKSFVCVYSLILFSECVFSGGPLKRCGRILLPSVQSSTLNNTLKNLPFEAHNVCAFIGCLVVSPLQTDCVGTFGLYVIL